MSSKKDNINILKYSDSGSMFSNSESKFNSNWVRNTKFSSKDYIQLGLPKNNPSTTKKKNQ